MKKLFLILAAAVVLSSVAFADKSRFYEGGKVIDTMYVDSEDGLRARDFPSLKSARLCSLPHRLPVKVVAVGREETIDGITAPWVEILLPRYEWKGEESEFGWVFGGYLAANPPSEDGILLTSSQQKEKYFAQGYFWADFPFFVRFYSNGRYKSFVEASPKNDEGRWSISDDNVLVLASDDSKYRDVYVITKYGYGFFEAVQNIDGHSLDCKFKLEISYINDSIRYGVSAKGTEYEQQYPDYWNPIMQEHQKKADAGR